MSDTVTALDEVTCSGKYKASEREAGREQKRVTDNTFQME